MTNSAAKTLEKRAGAGKPPPRLLDVKVIGGISAAINGVPVDLRGRKAKALLAFLALHAGKQIEREHLVGLFWSEVDEEHARASLRQTVKELRQAFSAAGELEFDAARGSVGLSAGAVQTDSELIAGRLENGEVARELMSLARAADSLFEGLDDLDPGFRVWLLGYRQRWSDQVCRKLEVLLDGPASNAAGKERVQSAASALINLDPTHEAACRCLMRLKMLAGDTAGALKL